MPTGAQAAMGDLAMLRCVLSELGWDPGLCLRGPSLGGAGGSSLPRHRPDRSPALPPVCGRDLSQGSGTWGRKTESEGWRLTLGTPRVLHARDGLSARPRVAELQP